MLNSQNELPRLRRPLEEKRPVYYFVGERFGRSGPKKRALYESCLRSYSRAMRSRYPNVERVEVPYEGTTLAAWFMKAPVEGRAPTVCFFDGLDSTKELSLLFGGVELANRGIHTLAIDGPGQGEALRLQDIPSRYDYEVPAGAAYDYVAGRADVDPKRVAVMAFSMGGYYAPRAAAFEKRFAAGVAWGAHWDYHANWIKRRKVLESGGTKVSAPHFQLPRVLGMPDMDACMKKLEGYRLAGIAEKIQCPFYCIHGENDNIVPAGGSKNFLQLLAGDHWIFSCLLSQFGICQPEGRPPDQRTVRPLQHGSV